MNTQRITKQRLEGLANTINSQLGMPVEPYTTVWNLDAATGERTRTMRSNTGNFHIDYSNGGVALERMSAGGGCSVIIPRSTKRELNDQMYALIAGIRLHREIAE